MPLPRERQAEKHGRFPGGPEHLLYTRPPMSVPRALVAVALALLPALASAASLEPEKSPAVLGRFDSVGVLVRVDEAPGTGDRPLRLSVNVGSFGEVTRLGPGVYRSVYTPPTTLFPQVALVAAWREDGPEARIDFVRLPLYGTTTIDVTGPAGSEVRVRVGRAEFGPVVTGAHGLAQVPLVVPPNEPEALIAVTDPKTGQVTRRRAKIAVPPYNRLTMALVPHAILADGEAWARVEAFYDTTGENAAPEKLALETTAGAAELVRASHGRFVYRYRPPPGTQAKEIDLKASVPGDRTARGAATLSLELPPPAVLAITPPKEALVADGHSTATFTVGVYDASGLGLPQQTLELMANGRTLPTPVHRGNGIYEAKLVAPATYPAGGEVQLSASVVRPDGETLLTTARVQVLPLPIPRSVSAHVTPSPLLADGQSTAVISLDVRDEAGLPLPGARLTLAAGDGQVGRVTEVGEGRYRAEYVAPEHLPASGDALVKIGDASGKLDAAVLVPLAPNQRLLLGPRVGAMHALGDFASARFGLDAWIPLKLGDARLALGLTAAFGQTSQTVRSAVFTSTATAAFVPLAVRLAYEAWLTPRVSVYFGAGAQATPVRVTTSLDGAQALQVGWGAQGFGGGALALGPGRVFAEIVATYAPVAHPDFSLDAGGLGVDVGYRFWIL